MRRVKQELMFDVDKIKAELEDEKEKLFTAQGEVKGNLAELSEYGTLFKLSSNYFAELNKSAIEDINDLVLSNLEFTIKKSRTLTDLLVAAEEKIYMVKALEISVRGLESNLKVEEELSKGKNSTREDELPIQEAPPGWKDKEKDPLDDEPF